MSFCIDTSSLIHGYSEAYPPDLFPALWVKLEALVTNGEMISPDEVLVELKLKKDGVLSWAQQRPTMFYPLSPAVQVQVAVIVAKYPKLASAGPGTGSSYADPFVVALAATNNFAVVTEEGSDLKAKIPKLPDVCKAQGVKSMKLVEVIRQKGWKF